MLEFAVYIKWFSRLYRAFYAVVLGFLRCRSDLFYAFILSFLRCHSELFTLSFRAFYAVILSGAKNPVEQRRGEKILRRFAPQNDKGGAVHSLCHSQHFALSFRAFCAVVLCFFTLSFWAFLRCHPERSEGSALQSVRERTETILCHFAPRRQKKPSTFRLRCRLHIPWFLLPFPNRTRFAGLRFGLDGGYRAAESSVLCQPR